MQHGYLPTPAPTASGGTQSRLRLPYNRTTLLLDPDVRDNAGLALAPDLIELSTAVMAIKSQDSTVDNAGLTVYLSLLLVPSPEQATALTVEQRAERADALGRTLDLAALNALKELDFSWVLAEELRLVLEHAKACDTGMLTREAVFRVLADYFGGRLDDGMGPSELGKNTEGHLASPLPLEALPPSADEDLNPGPRAALNAPPTEGLPPSVLKPVLEKGPSAVLKLKKLNEELRKTRLEAKSACQEQCPCAVWAPGQPTQETKVADAWAAEGQNLPFSSAAATDALLDEALLTSIELSKQVPAAHRTVSAGVEEEELELRLFLHLPVSLTSGLDNARKCSWKSTEPLLPGPSPALLERLT
eukprot:RCo050390